MSTDTLEHQAVFKDQDLSEATRKAIHDFALEARELLTGEIRDQLEGIYGIHASGEFEEPEDLPSLNDETPKNRYQRIRGFLEAEIEAGLEFETAYNKLIQEASFTHLNRLVAFKMMEERGLIREAVGRGQDSNGFKYYLADYPEAGEKWNRGATNEAYQDYLLWLASEFAEELPFLFDPNDVNSKLFPRPPVLSEILLILNAQVLSEAWKAGDAIGWVYQYFNEPELQAAFKAVSGGDKFEAEDIPAATQLFTLRWIVRYLVENTLGRLWVDMHPDSELASKLAYLVPFERSGAELQSIRDITLMDPACGSMHFGLVAFDLFVSMYEEEFRRAGEDGWPVKPPVERLAGIPAEILQNNLFGIDIDFHAIQLSALTLYIKAKTFHSDAEIKGHNLACADILAYHGPEFGTFLKELPQSRPIYRRVFKETWAKLGDIRQLGSLLRLERDISRLIEAERMKYEEEGRQPDLFDEKDEFEEAAASEEYWHGLFDEVLQLVGSQLELDEKADGLLLFGAEASKSIEVLDLLRRRYDIVVTNPPYMSRRKMNKTLAELLKDEYPEGKNDLYASFIMRALELIKDHGLVGMLTMHSFMFISSYEKLRDYITGQAAIRTMAHLGPGLFATGNPGTLQTTAFVLQHEPDAAKRAESVGTYFRLVHEPDAEAKRQAFEEAVSALQSEDGSV